MQVLKSRSTASECDFVLGNGAFQRASLRWADILRLRHYARPANEAWSLSSLRCHQH